MKKEKVYFELSLDSLRGLAGWAVACAGRAFPIIEEYYRDDSRPRAAIEAAREFAMGGKRSARLRVLAMEVYRAALEAREPAASATARAASLAASSAYTHPLVDVRQAMHILGPAAYAAFAIETHEADSPQAGNREVRWAIEHAPAEVSWVLRHVPTPKGDQGRLDEIVRALDGGLRGLYKGDTTHRE